MEKKKELLMLIPDMKPGMKLDNKEEEGEEEEESELSEDKMIYAEELMSALKEDDAEAFAIALNGFINC